jgi:hypothetical protein
MSKGTTIRNIRISDELWLRAHQHATNTDTNVSEAVRALMEAWVAGQITLD